VPYPTAPTGRRDQERHTAQFVEWMMGLPEGWVTESAMWSDMAPDRARRAQLKILGNGVVPQQASLAVATLLNILEQAA
jgi:DNA (cytosine-5)-methyltransferase 1